MIYSIAKKKEKNYENERKQKERTLFFSLTTVPLNSAGLGGLE
jgi:hypothetical protein